MPPSLLASPLPIDLRDPLSRVADPVLGLTGLLALLEDFRIVPERLHRSDVRALYQLTASASTSEQATQSGGERGLRYADFVQARCWYCVSRAVRAVEARSSIL